MLLNSVIIVVREVLEASLILSVLLAACRFIDVGTRWVIACLLGGLAGSAVMGLTMQTVSDLFDGVGQEVVNASLQFLVFAGLAACLFLIVRRYREGDGNTRLLSILMATTVAVAIAREGAEITVYMVGGWQVGNFFSGVLLGSVVGASIGVSIGVLFYYLLLSQRPHIAVPLCVVLLSLIGGGMCMQAAGLLIQADWLSASGPLWNSSAMLPEDSLPGQLLYALVGYEATPTAPEVIVYALSLAVAGICTVSGFATVSRSSGKR